MLGVPATPLQRLLTYITGHDTECTVDADSLRVHITTESAHERVIRRLRAAADILKVQVNVWYDGAPLQGPFSKSPPYHLTIKVTPEK